MVRDFEKKKKWEEFHRKLQFAEFEISKALKIKEAEGNIPRNDWLIEKAKKLQFQFDKTGLINYGGCDKLKKPVTFIPDNCQLETQDCFKHRRSLTEISQP